MNLYGLEAKEYWETHAPKRFAALENPDAFFDELGEQIADQVMTLSDQLAGTDQPNEEYLDKARRLTAAKRQAEEIVKHDLMLVEPEMNDAELREEWESARPVDEALITHWAMRFVEGQGPHEETPEVAAEWMLPEPFLKELADSETPWRVMEANTQLLKEAADRRFARWVANGAIAGQE
ncbi:MAG TPA: hypothetical protein VIQ11_01925 [Mycobacterium sp.]